MVKSHLSITACVAITFAVVPVTVVPFTTARSAEVAKVEVGIAKPDWKNLPGVDGQNHSLSDFKERELVVIAITCNHCPIALEYFDRLKEFTAKRCRPTDKVVLVAISVGDLESDLMPRMKELAERNGFNFPYLRDESQNSGRQLGATSTPQFFVLNRERTLVYRGAWDNNLNPTKVTKRYVEEAVDALLLGKSPPVMETKASGCAITYRK